MTKKKYGVDSDPNKALEAQKYKHPIPSRDVILNYLNDLKKPTVFENIAEALSLHSSWQLDALANRIGAMLRDEQLVQDQRYFRPFHKPQQIITGEVHIQNDGTALVSSSNKKTNAFLPPAQARLVFDGDIVCACILGLNRKNRLEARIDSIVKRNTHEIIGRYFHKLDTHIIQPISKTMPKHILLSPPKDVIEPNTLIKAHIIIQPSQFGPAVARFSEVIEEQSPVLTAISIASKKHNLIEEFSTRTLNSAKKLPDHVLDKEISSRKDLRDLPFVTIDGEDAKDFDDAVYAHKSTTGGWKLYVAIADVSYYVKDSSALDKEAQKRSTSVYFPGYVIPMLPERLSNELCSLKPRVDRLALICEMNISKNAKLTRYKFYSGVINSKARLTYTEVGKLLTHKDNSIYKDTPDLIPNLFDLYDLYKLLANARENRGAIDFDTVETQILLDEHQHISSIIPRHRNVAHRIIEECMLLANVATAKFFERNKTPAPYRVHQSPPSSKVQELKVYLKTLGIEFAPKEPITPQMYAVMLENAKTREDFNNIQLMSLKSMNQAIYTPDNHGHFGLAYDAYTHFTSPIRRYPDLLAHRTIKSILKEKKFGAKLYSAAELDALCAHASTQERNADAASNDVEKWLKCHFLQDRIGEIFTGKITHVTGFGFFVELTENYIEGLVHIASIPNDYYIFDDTRHRLVGERTKKIYTIGQEVQIQLIRVDLEGGHIDFELAINGVGRNDLDNYSPNYRSGTKKPKINAPTESNKVYHSYKSRSQKKKRPAQKTASTLSKKPRKKIKKRSNAKSKS
ncbi:ribonuclease R [Fangia hongkongensis]|uniref:ribonuclease R n=1 Tax=Fangia hongkongensis TaxID=270495 RepID=UPI00035E15F0|nr:ribonuclease R [Fangia hongkongensis]MBK2125785.1 ribonuclease R [Fangia hongkongensis]